MKEMLHQRIFETGSYKSLPKHIALYEALEASIERAQRDEFLTENDKSRKRRRDDQDPPPPQPDSDQNAPSSSSKQQSGPHAEQPVDDIPIQDSDNISNSEDTDSAHLPKTKQSKGSGQALLISKMKAALYRDFGLELIVPEHMWIDNYWDLKDFKDSYYYSVYVAGYKDTTAAELQLLEDLLLSRG
ncbi:hypothetical protein Tco_1070733 [Tanacetum coccineum]|uniref:Uncharacterized protein n=1 Tax=Tanacetum coccineum TaxID=301880 RepID=A0ABQ5HM98_9ASTR